MKELTTIQNKIYEIRGQRVMLDRDLAEMYGVETKVLNKAVKRNIERFPDRFMFQLTKEESLRFQIGTLNDHTVKQARGQHLKYLPYVFTEQGVSMLSAVLRSPTAVQVCITIMDAFVQMRSYLATASDTLSARLESMDRRILELEQTTYTHSTLQTFSTQTRIIDYSEKSLVIFPFRKADIKLLKQIGASYNPWLNIKGVPIAGWIFPKSRQHELQQLIHNNRIIQ